MSRTKANEKLVTFSRGKIAVDGKNLEVAIKPSEVTEVLPDMRYGQNGAWTLIILRNKNEYSVEHSLTDVVNMINSAAEEKSDA